MPLVRSKVVDQIPTGAVASHSRAPFKASRKRMRAAAVFARRSSLTRKLPAGNGRHTARLRRLGRRASRGVACASAPPCAGRDTGRHPHSPRASGWHRRPASPGSREAPDGGESEPVAVGEREAVGSAMAAQPKLRRRHETTVRRKAPALSAHKGEGTVARSARVEAPRPGPPSQRRRRPAV